MSVPSSLVPKSLTPVTSALEKFLLREEDEERCDVEGNPSGGSSNALYIPKSASAEAALASGKAKEEREDSHPESGLEKY